MDSKISVIVPVFKVEQYLDRCIESIVNQNYDNLEVILVDDGSPDRCPQICDKWALKDTRILVIHKNNGGLSDARNAGLDISTGDYISFIDGDDWILPGMYRAMTDAIENEKADICACSILSCYPNKEIKWGGKSYRAGDSREMLDLLYSDSGFPVCAMNKLYKKELWNNFRFPVGKICEDAFTTYLLIHKADRIVQIAEAYYCYRIRPNSIMTSAFSHKSMDEEEAWKKNYEFIKVNYPDLFRKAYSFYLQSVNVLIHRINTDQRNTFKNEYHYLKKIMLNNLLFMLFQSTVSIKYRVKFLFDTVKA